MNVDTMTDTARLTFEDKEVELPVVRGSEGEVGLDISKLRAQTGLVTLDRGFKNTGSTTSGITFLNGEEGILHYRGYSIEDLAENATFMEVAYLLVYGDLPDAERLEWFTKSISKHTLVHENMRRFFDAFPMAADTSTPHAAGTQPAGGAAADADADEGAPRKSPSRSARSLSKETDAGRARTADDSTRSPTTSRYRSKESDELATWTRPPSSTACATQW